MNSSSQGRGGGVEHGHGHHATFLYSSLARGLSFILAVSLSALVFVYPKAIATSASEINHGILSLMMWGIAAGFVHGVGFDPIHQVWRILFGPLLGWSLMLLGIGFLLWQGA